MVDVAPDVAERIRIHLREHPEAMMMEVARAHDVAEYAVLTLLGPPRAIVLDVTRWEAMLRALETLGHVRVLVSNSGATMETRGVFGGFSRTGDYFNVQTATLDLHVRVSALGAAVAVEKPSHQTGHPTASVQLFDQVGATILKAFLLFGDHDTGVSARRAAFDALRDTFRQPAVT